LRYPAGALRAEAEVTRIDALLATRQERSALEQLDRLHQTRFEGLPRKSELSLQAWSSARCSGALLAGRG
jgi:hypothetical protein